MLKNYLEESDNFDYTVISVVAVGCYDPSNQIREKLYRLLGAQPCIYTLSTVNDIHVQPQQNSMFIPVHRWEFAAGRSYI